MINLYQCYSLHYYLSLMESFSDSCPLLETRDSLESCDTSRLVWPALGLPSGFLSDNFRSLEV